MIAVWVKCAVGWRITTFRGIATLADGLDGLAFLALQNFQLVALRDLFVRQGGCGNNDGRWEACVSRCLALRR
jgi:hypothetical protein